MRKGTGGNLSGTERLRVAIIFRGTRAANLLAVPSLGSLRECSFRTLRCHTRRKQRLTATRHYELWPAITFERVVAAVISPKKLLSIENEVAQRFLFGCYFAPQFALLETAVRTKLLITFQCFSEFDTSARSEY